MSNTTFNATISVPPTFVARPGQANSSIITRLNTSTKFVVKADTTDGRLDVDEPITVKNSINDVAPVQLTQLIDVNSALLEDKAILIFNANTQYFETRVVTEFDNLSISNTLSISSLSANGSVGAAGQILISNGDTVYWGEQFVLPDEIDGGFY